jgi:hypothetical protein
MTSFALMTSAQLNARLAGLLEVLQEVDEFHPACVRDLADEMACLLKVINRRSTCENLDAAIRDLDACVHAHEAAMKQ